MPPGPAGAFGHGPGALVGGRYGIVRKLADGGMGTIWVARHRMLGCELALKLLTAATPSTYEGALAQFEREAQAAAKLGTMTDYVVRVFDYGVDGATPFIAMELLDGEDLGARLRRRGALPAAEVAAIAAPIAGALRKAHENGLVHRDLSPENVFLLSRDDEERVKVLDFGLVEVLMVGEGEPPARAGHGCHGHCGTAEVAPPLAGTLHYMAPELLVSHRLDHRADLWSFAALLYHAVTGVVPFDADSPGELVLAICNRPVRPPSVVAPDLGTNLDAFFERALRRDPEARFQHATELARAFAEAARVSWHPPPSLPPPPRPSFSPTPYSPPPPEPRAEGGRRGLLGAPAIL